MGTIGVMWSRARHVALAAVVMAVGCGGGNSSPRKPDTGYGAGETPPATLNCTDFCQRLSDCAAQLCDEDTMSMNYTALADVLVPPCDASCTDATLQAKLTTSQWQCFFESSCRQVVDASYDVCHANSSYSCS
jgi:hypothetical protein